MFKNSKLIVLSVIILIGLITYFLLPDDKKIITFHIVGYLLIVYFAWTLRNKKKKIE